MIKRLELILKTQNLTPSLLADKLNIQRSGISHLLSGRNKPSLDFITKVLSAFPEINSDWLLFGKGNMYKNQEQMLDLGLPPLRGEQTTSTFSENPQGLFQKQNSVENHEILFNEHKQTEGENNIMTGIKTVDELAIRTGTSAGISAEQEVNTEQEIRSSQGINAALNMNTAPKDIKTSPQMKSYSHQTHPNFVKEETLPHSQHLKEQNSAGIWAQNKEKEIEKIIVFYSNGNFKEYFPS